MTTIGRRAGALWRDCGDRVVVLLPGESDPMMLNGLGRLLWLATEAPGDDEAIAADVAAVLRPPDLEAAERALAQLRRRGVLEPAP